MPPELWTAPTANVMLVVASVRLLENAVLLWTPNA